MEGKGGLLWILYELQEVGLEACPTLGQEAWRNPQLADSPCPQLEAETEAGRPAFKGAELQHRGRLLQLKKLHGNKGHRTPEQEQSPLVLVAWHR